MDLEDMVRSLNYSSEIARKYGKELPIAAKMTDVPEHSWILPILLKNAGIEFLHLGCNPASTSPDVPPLFWWEGPDGSRILVMYSSDYGVGALPSDDWNADIWLGLKMTGDNQGPPSVGSVQQDIQTVKNAGLTYQIGSLDDFAKEILKTDLSDIPVVRGDMPDTWIHGIMSAPEETKIARNTRPKIYQLDSLNTLLNLMDVDGRSVENVIDRAYEDAIRFEITLYGDQDYIDIDWEVDGKEEDPWPIADWLTFPFAIENPQYRLYRLGGVMDPETEIVKDTNVNNLVLDGGMMIYGGDGKGVALCSKDAPMVSVGEPGIWKFDKGDNAFDPEFPTVFLNLFNNQWDTNYPTWNGGDWSTNVRIWSISSADYEESLVTPSRETRNQLVAACSDRTDGTQPLQKEGVKLSAKGVEVTAFGPNIDGEGTILRLWEQSGKDQKVTVTLPEELKATMVIPVDLRGQQTGKAIKVTNHQFEIEIGKNAPFTVLLEYETGTEAVDDVTEAAVTDVDENGSVEITWKSPEHCNYAKVIAEYRNNSGDAGSVSANAEDGKILLENLEPSSLYTFRLYGQDICENRSQGVTVKHKTTGQAVLTVQAAAASNTFNSEYDPINVANGSGLTGRNPDTALHDNNKGAYTMWHTGANPGRDTWITFDFGELKAIDKMYVWNMNQQNGTTSYTDRGFKNVKIEYSSDGETWEELPAPEGISYKESTVEGYPFQLARASGTDGITATNLNTEEQESISFHGICTRFVRINACDSYGSAYWGLSEVLFTEAETRPVASVEMADVVWEEMDPDSYAQEGVFTVNGEIAGTTVKAQCTVTVKKAIGPEDRLTDVSIADHGDGTYILTWEEPDAAFDKVIVKYQSAKAKRTVEVKKGVKSLTVEDLNSAGDYRFDLWLKDSDGRTSDVTTLFFHADGIMEAEVKNVTASSEWGGGVQALNTVNKSGMTGSTVENYRHDNDGNATTMWHVRTVDNISICYDFGTPIELDQMYIWNMNQNNNIERGFKNVKITYSTDGEKWTALPAPEGIAYGDAMDAEYPFQFAKASGENGILATNLNTEDHQPIAFQGITARYVKLTPKDSWGSANYWGLSEVIFTKQEETAITSVEETSVKTVKGQVPELPSFVKVTYASGSEGMKAVEWDDFDKALCDAEGEFTVTGKLFGSDAKAYCTVVVKRSKEVDKKTLLKLLNEVTGKEESAYTKESWQALLAVYGMADQIYDSTEANQEEVDEICVRLQNAISQLEMTVTPEQVEEQITLAGQMLAQTEIYTGEEGFEGQIAEADAAVFRDRFHALQAEYDKMAAEENLTEYEKAKLAEIQSQLKEATDVFQASIVHIDFTKLNELLAQAGGLAQAKYTEASWKELASARNEADAAVKNSSKVKQSEVDARTSRLALAMKNLVPKTEDSGKVPDQGSDKDTAILQGKVYESGNYRYKVTSTTKRTVEVVSLKKKNLTEVRIGSTVRLGGKDYKITSIASSAFKNNKKIKSAVIGKNVTSIRSKAFYGCRQLKSITIQTKKLTMKNVGSKAFKGIAAKAVIKVPKAKVKSYARILKAKGAGKKMTVKKI